MVAVVVEILEKLHDKTPSHPGPSEVGKITSSSNFYFQSAYCIHAYLRIGTYGTPPNPD
jgi:hypothetical protein